MEKLDIREEQRHFLSYHDNIKVKRRNKVVDIQPDFAFTLIVKKIVLFQLYIIQYRAYQQQNIFV